MATPTTAPRAPPPGARARATAGPGGRPPRALLTGAATRGARPGGRRAAAGGRARQRGAWPWGDALARIREPAQDGARAGRELAVALDTRVSRTAIPRRLEGRGELVGALDPDFVDDAFLCDGGGERAIEPEQVADVLGEISEVL